MLLITHIVFALASLILMGGALVGRFFNRKGNYERLAKLSWGAAAGMLSTGTALVIVTHSPILGSCLQGLMYLGITFTMYVAYSKLAVE